MTVVDSPLKGCEVKRRLVFAVTDGVAPGQRRLPAHMPRGYFRV